MTYTVNGGSRGGAAPPPPPCPGSCRGARRGPAPGARTVHAVKGVSFAAYKGEAIGLIGSNGSGKSTLLKAVAGLLPCSEGRVYTHGQPSLLGVKRRPDGRSDR